MRLINVRTLELEEFFNDPKNLPNYAILSHTWGSQEATLTDMQNNVMSSKKGFQKIRFGCRQALKDGFAYLWVDTCCIDKSSSAELSESINSMFEWYRKSQVCYAYLEGLSREDMPMHGESDDESLPATELTHRESPFGQHRWFQRGWTLQELIAPSKVEFFGKDWEYLGSSLDLLDAIVAITKIDERILNSDSDRKMEFLYAASIAQRMSWAATRSTTRPEDEAYCLLGLFGVSMPMLYGEGPAAFLRLQEEIMKRSSDQTIFAWHSSRGDGVNDGSLLLAPNTACFKDCATLHALSLQDIPEPYSLTNAGLNINMHLLSETESHRGDIVAVLSCRYYDEPHGFVGLRLSRVSSQRQIPNYYINSDHAYRYRGFRRKTVKLSWDIMEALKAPTRTVQLLLRNPTRPPPSSIRIDSATAFFIDENFGFCRELQDFDFGLGMQIKSLYPARHWRKTPLDNADMLLLPSSIKVGAIRVRHRNASFVVSFGLEIKNWRNEAPVAWIDMQDTTGDLSIHDVVHRKEEHYRIEGFVKRRIGRNKATLNPKQFPDDLLEVSISRELMIRGVIFLIRGTARKLTVPGLTANMWDWEVQQVFQVPGTFINSLQIQ